jgi:tetratricopeptide (TPR) repeat protein
VWHQKLGDLYHRAIDDRAKAAQCYLDALALEPSMQLVYRLDTVTKTDQILPYRNILKATKESIATLHPIVGSIEAKVLLGLGQRRDAEIAMEKSWNAYQQQIQKKQLPPSSIILWFANLAIIFNDDPELGEAFVTRIIGSEPAPDELLGLASYWWELDRAKADYSISILDQIIENPSFSDETKVSAIMTKGAFLIEDGRYEAGEKIYRKLAQAKPNNPLILNNLAYVVGVYLNKPEEGLVIAMEAARLAPRHPSIIDTISKIHELMGDFQKAAETLDYLLQIDPINAKVMARLSLLYAEHLDQAERALLLAQRARSQRPRSPEALDALGWSYIQLGQVAKGEKFLQRSIANGETAIAYIHMAQLVMNEGEYDEALGHIRLAEELSRDQYTLDRIRSIKDDIRKKQTFVGQ